MKQQKRIKSKKKLRKQKESQNGGESWSSVGHIIPALKHAVIFPIWNSHTHSPPILRNAHICSLFCSGEVFHFRHYRDLKILCPLTLLGQDTKRTRTRKQDIQQTVHEGIQQS